MSKKPKKSTVFSIIFTPDTRELVIKFDTEFISENDIMMLLKAVVNRYKKTDTKPN